MKKIIFSLTALFLTTSFSLTAMAEDDFMAECKQYAKEAEIAAEDMNDYIKECIEDLTAESAGQSQEKSD